MSVPNPSTTEWVPLQGTRLDGMIYWGVYESSRIYNDGDCAIAPNGVLYMCVKDGTVGITPSTWPGRPGPQGAKGDSGPQGLQGVGVPMPVVNGQWIKGVGGSAVWAPLLTTDVPGLVVPDVAWRYVGAGGQPGYENGWLAYDTASPTYQARFRKDANNVVWLSGLIRSGTVDTPVFTLPVGYRPAGILHFPLVANAGFAYAHVNYPGVGHVRVNGPSVNAWCSLDGVSFHAES